MLKPAEAPEVCRRSTLSNADVCSYHALMGVLALCMPLHSCSVQLPWWATVASSSLCLA